MPYIGCLIGSAFQQLTSELEATLKREKLNITAPEYMILRALYSKDGLQQCEIADMVGKDKASVSRCVASLSKKELVKTQQVSHKCCKVWLTSGSEQIKPKILEVAEKRHNALLSLCSKEEFNIFVKVLKSITNPEKSKSV